MTVKFYRWLSDGASNDKTRFPIEATPVRLMPGGLEKVPEDGFVLLGYGSMDERSASRHRNEVHMRPISGEKLVYRVGGSNGN